MNLKITQIAQAAESTHTHTHTTQVQAYPHKTEKNVLEQYNKAAIKESQTPWQQVEKSGNEEVDELTLTLRGRRDDRKLGADWTNESGNRILRLTVSVAPIHPHTHTHPFGQHTRTHTHPVAKYPCARQIMTVAGLRTTCHLPNSHIHCHLPLPITYLSTGLRATCF